MKEPFAIAAQLVESSKEGLERKMRELVVEVLTLFAESHPYLLLACALIGSMWLARSLLHKARLFTQIVVREIRGGKAELSEWGGELSELRRELTMWKVETGGERKPHAQEASSVQEHGGRLG